MRTGFHREAFLKALLQLVARRRRIQVVRLLVFRTAESSEQDPLAVEGDFEIVRRLQPANDVDGFPIQLRADHVFAVDGEVVPQEDAAARADRQPLDVVVLRQVAADAERFLGRPDLRIADRQAADLPRRRKVPLHQHRRHAQHVSDVVEAVRAVVGRQERRDVDVERQQIADRVAVLRAIEAMQHGPARIGMRRGRLVDGRLEVGREPGERRLVRTRHADRRHQAAAHLPDHLFPGRRPPPGDSGRSYRARVLLFLRAGCDR